MKKMYEKMHEWMKFVGAVFLVVASVACSDDKERCVPDEAKPENSAVALLPTRSYEEALSLAQESIGIVNRGWGGSSDGYFASSVPVSAGGDTYNKLEIITGIVWN